MTVNERDAREEDETKRVRGGSCEDAEEKLLLLEAKDVTRCGGRTLRLGRPETSMWYVHCPMVSV